MTPTHAPMEISELPLAQLRCHEQIDPRRLREVLEEVQRGQLVPILVDRATGVILDGHHRFQAYRHLGFAKIPCYLIDYQAHWIEVRSRRPEVTVTKAEVLRRALSGELFPPKTTRHILHWPR